MTHPIFQQDRYVAYLSRETHRTFAFSGRTADDVTAWQRSFRPVLKDMLGIDAIESRGLCDLSPEQLGEEDAGDHIREEWSIQSEPGLRIPFFLLRPRVQSHAVPLVLTPHGHGKAGKRTYAGLWDTDEERQSIEEGERDIAIQAVREGYVAIAPDMRGFADLRRTEEKEQDATSSCRTLQLHALLFGRTLVGERVFDVGRLIDYAATRPEIDTDRTVVTGNSGGGTVSLFAAACDERNAIAVPSSYFCTFEHSIGSIHHCECNYVPGMMRTAEMYDVAGLIAPRPFLAVAGVEDPIFPIQGVREAYAKLAKIYAAAGVPSRCRLSENDGGHRYYKRDVWPFVAQWIGGR